MPGPFRTRAEAIAASRRKTPRYRVPFPDLSVEHRTAPCSDVICAIHPPMQFRADSHTARTGMKVFPVCHSHKSGLQLITPGMLTNGELEWMSGKKS